MHMNGMPPASTTIPQNPTLSWTQGRAGIRLELIEEFLINLPCPLSAMKFEVEIFDIDNVSLGRFILGRFDAVILIKGGHSLKALKNNSKIYEIKNGPYFGSEIDKVYI